MNKEKEAYKSIKEVAEILNLYNSKNGKPNTHTIRYWETEFKQIKPKIFAGKRRYFDHNTISILKHIKYLLKEKGMTIKGVKKILNQEGSLELDVLVDKSIKAENLKNKLIKISNSLKNLKKLK